LLRRVFRRGGAQISAHDFRNSYRHFYYQRTDRRANKAWLSRSQKRISILFLSPYCIKIGKHLRWNLDRRSLKIFT
jgi:hypothetical protein